MSIEIIGLRFTHRKSINPSLYGPFFNYFGGGILRYYLQIYEEQENEHHHIEKIGIINSFSLEKLWLYHLLPLLEEYLGSRVEDVEIKQLLNREQEIFTKSN